VRAGYIDTSAELGHLLEVCQLEHDDLAFFNALVSESSGASPGT
jgi:serine/threonine-protein kinase RIO1